MKVQSVYGTGGWGSRQGAGLGQTILQPGQGEGNPFLRMKTEAISQLQTRLWQLLLKLGTADYPPIAARQVE